MFRVSSMFQTLLNPISNVAYLASKKSLKIKIAIILGDSVVPIDETSHQKITAIIFISIATVKRVKKKILIISSQIEGFR